MGRKNNDPTVIHSSSIALLQERFRQLQRVKERREERELLRLFSPSERVSPSMRHEPYRPFLHPELIIPPEPPLQSSLTFPSESQRNRAVDTSPLLMTIWPTDRSTVKTRNTFDDDDVDTSLHL